MDLRLTALHLQLDARSGPDHHPMRRGAVQQEEVEAQRGGLERSVRVAGRDADGQAVAGCAQGRQVTQASWDSRGQVQGVQWVQASCAGRAGSQPHGLHGCPAMMHAKPCLVACLAGVACGAAACALPDGCGRPVRGQRGRRQHAHSMGKQTACTKHRQRAHCRGGPPGT